MENKKELAIIILAAGKSSRLGLITKQLLKYNGVTLLKELVKKLYKLQMMSL